MTEDFIPEDAAEEFSSDDFENILNNIAFYTMGDDIAFYKRTALTRQPLKDAPLKELFKKITETHDESIRQEIIEHNLPLVIYIAKRYAGRGVDFMDLIQDGNVGLIKAVNKFDWQRENTFSTYAVWWIRYSITHAISRQMYMTRLSAETASIAQKMRRASHEFIKEFGFYPDLEEMGVMLDLPAGKILEAYEASQKVLSLHASGKDEVELESVIADSRQQADFKNLEIRELVDKLLDLAPERATDVIRMRFGVQDEPMQTVDEIAAVTGFSTDRVRDLERRALRKIRAHGIRENLYDPEI